MIFLEVEYGINWSERLIRLLSQGNHLSSECKNLTKFWQMWGAYDKWGEIEFSADTVLYR